MTNDADVHRGRHADSLRTLLSRLRLVPLWALSVLQGMNARSLVRSVPSGRWAAALRGKARIYAVDLDLGALARSSEIGKHLTAVVVENEGNRCAVITDPFHPESCFAFASSTRRVYELKQPIVHVSSGRALVGTGNPDASRWVGLAAGSTPQEVHLDDIRPILRRRRQTRRLDSSSVIAVVPWTRNYFHWIVEVIPTLVRMNTHEGSRESLTLPVSSKQILLPYQSESLGVLDIRPVVVHESFVEPERALLASSPGLLTLGTSDGQQLETFRRKCLETVTAARSLHDEVTDAPVFISRSLASRYSTEAKELEDILRGQGWHILNCECMSLGQQVRLFSQLDFVAGSHGAGLGNVAWMKPGTRLVEVGNREYWHACVPLLAKIMNVRYSYLDLEQAGPQATADRLTEEWMGGS